MNCREVPCCVSYTHQVFGKILDKKLGNQFKGNMNNQWPCGRKMPTSSTRGTPVSQVKSALAGLFRRNQRQYEPSPPVDDAEFPSLFASAGSIGVVDLGASQSVIGSQQVPELLNQIPEWVRKDIKRKPCNLVFRFGNHQTLVSRQALLLPLGSHRFQIAIVEGQAPFLISSTFLKGIKAVIDTDLDYMWSKVLNRELKITRTSKNLILMDLNQLWENPEANVPVNPLAADPNCLAAEHVKTLDSGSSSSQVNEEAHPETTHNGGSETCESNGDKGVNGDASSHSANQPETAVPAVENHHAESMRVTAEMQRAPLHQADSGSSSPSQQDRSEKLLARRVKEETEKSAESTAEIRKMSLSQLEQKTIQFGKAKLGVKFSEAFSDHKWTDWFVSQYEKSDKASHQKFITYVEKRLDQEAPQSPAQKSVKKKTAKAVDSEASWSHGRQHRQRGQCRRDEQTGRSFDDETLHDGRSGDSSLRGEQNDAPAHGQHRGGSERIDRPCQGSDNGAIDDVYLGVQQDSMHDMNMDFKFNPPADCQSQTFKNMVQKLVKQFSGELQAVKTPRFHQRRLDVLEVMCHADSEPTKQVQAIGSSAQRFGLAQGDLSTIEGRNKLFHVTKASCQAWLKLLIANEVRIGGLWGSVPKPANLRQFPNHLGWPRWSVLRPMYQVAIG